MIKELLEKRELLNDIATELYGELWVTVDEFWGSPTEKEMAERAVYFSRESSSATQEQTAASEEISASASSLAELAGQLQQTLGKFKVR